MNAVIDIGNSRIKAALFEDDRQVSVRLFPVTGIYPASRWIGALDAGVPLIVSDVAGRAKALAAAGKKGGRKVLVLSGRTPVPIRVNYRPRHALGHDRLANAVGAASLFRGLPVLVLDAGTCLKCDLVDGKKTFRGGAIAPGMLMRYEALHRSTARLPHVAPSEKVPSAGQTTRLSIVAGVQQGMVHEMEGVVRAYRRRYPRLRVVLTGGDWVYFANFLKSPIFVAPGLTLLGLNEILNFNRSRGT